MRSGSVILPAPASVFSFLFKAHCSAQQAQDFLNRLEIFKIGLSWGGVNSLAVVYPDIDRPGQILADVLCASTSGWKRPLT